jgi:FemAB family protein
MVLMISTKKILEAFSEAGASVKLASEDPENWESVWEAAKFQPVSYSEDTLKYLFEYYRQKFDVLEDVSLVIFSGNAPVAVLPLSYSHLSSDKCISTFGLPVYPPLFSAAAPTQIKTKIARSSVRALKKLAQDENLYLNAYAQKGALGYPPRWQDEWHLEWMRSGATANPIYNLHVDLSAEPESIFLNFRKRYRPLINKAAKLWRIDEYIGPSIDPEIWNEFKHFHFEVSLRSTRSETTWAIQYERLVQDNAVLFTLRDPASGKMVGGSYFAFTRDEATYSTGVFDRSRFDQPLGHLVQWAAIKFMKHRNIKFYLLGQRSIPSDLPTPSQKELSISHFKEGFVSNISVDHLLKFDGRRTE